MSTKKKFLIPVNFYVFDRSHPFYRNRKFFQSCWTVKSEQERRMTSSKGSKPRLTAKRSLSYIHGAPAQIAELTFVWCLIDVYINMNAFHCKSYGEKLTLWWPTLITWELWFHFGKAGKIWLWTWGNCAHPWLLHLTVTQNSKLQMHTFIL